MSRLTNISYSRSKNYLNQLKGSLVFRILTILVSFLILPFMIKYLGDEKYGVWSTLLSILSWIVMFDLGITNGLRNRLSEMIAQNKRIKAQEYISTTYAAISFISIFVGVIFFLFSGWINWSSVFNTTAISRETLEFTVNISFLFVLINLIFSTVNQVLNALQKTNIVLCNQFLANFLAFIFIFILYKYTNSNLKYLAITYGLSIFLSNSIITIWVYKKYADYKPNIKLIRKDRLSDTLSLGSKFFIIQIAALILFTTDRLVISQLLGPEYVTPYDIVFKLFSIVTVLHGVIIAPLWNSYSDAYHRNDYVWMKNMMKKQLKILIGIIFISVILLILMPDLIQIWVGDISKLTFNMIFALFIFTLLQAWNNVFAMFLNGINETRLQVKTAIFAAIINIPLSVFFVKYCNMGIDGIVLGTIAALSVFSILGPCESYNKLYKVKNE